MNSINIPPQQAIFHVMNAVSKMEQKMIVKCTKTDLALERNRNGEGLSSNPTTTIDFVHYLAIQQEQDKNYLTLIIVEKC